MKDKLYLGNLCFWIIMEIEIFLTLLANTVSREFSGETMLDHVLLFLLVRLVVGRWRKRNKISDSLYCKVQIVLYYLFSFAMCRAFCDAHLFYMLLFILAVLAYIFRDKALYRFQTKLSLIIVVVWGIIARFPGIARAPSRVESFFEAVALVIVAKIMLAQINDLLFHDRKDYEQEQSQDDLLKVVEAKCDEARCATRSKSAFLSNMSHEIRTPINGILGMNAILLKECTDDNLREYAKNIQSAGQQLLSIVNDVLDISKIESGKMEILPVEYEIFSILNDCYQMVRARLEAKPIEFEMQVNENLPSRLYGDEVRVRQVINNFLTNAAKYTRAGRITFSLDYEELSSDQIQLIVKVSDTGIGIKEEDLKKLFQSFTRIEEKRNRNIEGTGLGLNLAKNLVDLMGGDISVESVYEEGSCFTARIPQKVISTEPIGDFATRYQQFLDASDADVLSIYAPDARLLVVDDVDMNLKVVTGLLKKTGIQIDTASSGSDCLEYVKAKRYDIIFLDHMMPDMDGIETLGHIKRLAGCPNQDTPIIMLTANAIIGAKEEYLRAGFTDYLTKPIREEELQKMLVKYLRADLLLQPEEYSAAPKEPGEQPDNGPAGDEKQDVMQRLHDITELDIQTGLGYCMNEDEFYVEILKEYMKADKVSTLEQCFRVKDWENYRTVAHALKSTSLTVGAVHLSGEGKALEMAAKDGDADYIALHHDAVLAEYISLTDRLKEILG